MNIDFNDMLGLNVEDEQAILSIDNKITDLDIDEIVQQCKKGEFKDIAEGGSVKCYEINPKYVLVVRSVDKAEVAKKLKDISSELREMQLNVHTVVDFQTDEEYCYELQSRAKGEIFKHRMLEPDLIKEINEIQENLNKGRAEKYEQDRAKLYLEQSKRVLEKNPPKSRKDEYMRRCSMLMQMPKEHIVQYFDTIVTLSRFYRLGVDTVGEGNLLYDKETGFNFIDVDFFDKPSRKVSTEHLLDIDNSDTMTELIGMEYIDDIDENDKTIVLKSMRDSLKKIVSSVIDSRICGEKLSEKTIQSGLESYKKYGIDITLEEIISDLHRGDKLLESGIEATEIGTNIEQMNKQTSLIKEQFKDKEKQQDQVEQ